MVDKTKKKTKNKKQKQNKTNMLPLNISYSGHNKYYLIQTEKLFTNKACNLSMVCST